MFNPRYACLFWAQVWLVCSVNYNASLCRKGLFTTGVHNLVHLNLAVSLFVADLIFAVGVELGASSVVRAESTVK